VYSRKIINFFSELIIFYFPYIYSCHLLFNFSFLLYNIHINVYIFKSKVVSYNIPRCLTRTNNLQFNLRLMTRLIADTSVILKFTVVRIFNDIVCRLHEQLVREMYTALPNVASCQTSFWRKRHKVAKLDL